MKGNPKPKYLQPEQGGQRERWLISYTDLVTVLLILFVAIAAQGFHAAEPSRAPAPHSPQPKSGAQQVPAPQKTQVPASHDVPSHETSSHQALIRADEKLRSQGVDSRLEQRGLVISLPKAILFPSGEDHVLAAALPIVSQVAEVLATVPNKVALVGHADSMPIHNKRFRNNWELSSARSLSLLELLSTRYGIPESRLSVQSYGSNDPKNSNDTEAGRAENRRVEIWLLDESAQ